MKTYELNSLISAKLDEEERNAVIQGIENLIQKNEGKIISTNSPIEVSLAYPINKEVRAHLVVLNFSYDKDLSDLKKEMEKEEKILRTLLKITPVPRKIPQPRKWGKIKEEKKVELEDIDKKIEEIFNPVKRRRQDAPAPFKVELKEDEFK